VAAGNGDGSALRGRSGLVLAQPKHNACTKRDRGERPTWGRPRDFSMWPGQVDALHAREEAATTARANAWPCWACGQAAHTSWVQRTIDGRGGGSYDM
jgi:hypothetical protein